MVLSADAMRRLEAAAMARGDVSGRVLMARAGAGVADAIRADWPALRRALVLCGPGNNGGDGFVIARQLKAAGWRVVLCLLGDPDRLPPDAAYHCAEWRRSGAVAPFDAATLARSASALAAGDGTETGDGGAGWLLVDALFGIGQRAPLDAVLDPVHAALDAVPGCRGIVAVDLPTGRDADTGAALAARPLSADLVVTFHDKKPIHDMDVLGDARIAVVDIGLQAKRDGA